MKISLLFPNGQINADNQALLANDGLPDTNTAFTCQQMKMAMD
jgi:hypothetical protein